MTPEGPRSWAQAGVPASRRRYRAALERGALGRRRDDHQPDKLNGEFFP
jgi:hypothetical protein